MTRACLIHALHPDEEEGVILSVSYARPGWMRVGVEALWRVAGPKGGGDGAGGAAAPHQAGPRTLSGWDRDMPAVGGNPEGLRAWQGEETAPFVPPTVSFRISSEIDASNLLKTLNRSLATCIYLPHA